MIYIDTDDDRDAEMSIRLTGLYDLSADDFILQDAIVDSFYLGNVCGYQPQAISYSMI